MHLPEGFLLGLSTGTVCLAYCGPVLLPYLMSEGSTVIHNTLSVGLFLGGRFLAYMLVGMASGLAGALLIPQSFEKSVFFGIIYLLLAIFLISYGFYRFKEICLGTNHHAIQKMHVHRWPLMVPVLGGFITGLNLCPPFLLAIAEAIKGERIIGGMLFFTMFFLGTSVFFLPLPFIGVFRRRHVLQIIGKFASVLAGLIYLYKGVILLFIV